MNPILLRLFVPVLVGVLLGLVFAFRGFLRAWRGAPDSPGIVRLLSGLVGASPVTKLFYAEILAFVAAQPGVEGVPRFAKADVFFVAGNVMGLMALAQGFVAAARMPKMLAFRGPSGNPLAIPVTLMIQGFFETPAIFAMIGGIIALQMTN